ncbi:MAG: T9SS C-terminal target domain-containing protein [Cytophagales bacterium]|nr:MAG: T9SS C-terminal target domain-containing protein [Cytophagales bacterium]
MFTFGRLGSIFDNLCFKKINPFKYFNNLQPYTMNMKRIALLFFLLFSITGAYAQVVVPAAGYSYDFETPGIDNWVPSVEAVQDFQLGVPAVMGVPAGGTRTWATNLIGNYSGSTGANADDSYELISPNYNIAAMTVLAAPSIRFDAWHEFEASLSASAIDGAQWEFSIDGGGTWNLLGAIGAGANWYQSNYSGGTFAGEDCWSDVFGTGGSSAWSKRSFQLPCAIFTPAVTQVRFRIRVHTEGTAGDAFRGFGFDNFEILPGQVDARAAGITMAPTSFVLGAAEPLNVQIQNLGGALLTNVPVEVTIQGPITVAGPGATVTSTGVATGVVNCGATATLPVTGVTLDMLQPGLYSVSVNLNAVGDAVPANDLANINREKLLLVTITNTTPYTENFEGATTPYIPVQATTTTAWVRGDPSKTVINDPFEGSNCAATNLSADYTVNADAFMYTPVFDFSSPSLASPNIPALSFMNIFKTEPNFDGMFIEFLLGYPNTGTSAQDASPGFGWQVLGDFGEGSNWYTNEAENFWDNNSTKWVRSMRALEMIIGATGASRVRFRFRFQSDAAINDEGAGVDKIEIGTAILKDISVQDVSTPVSATNLLLPQTVTAVLENTGGGPITDYTISYTVVGPTGTFTASESATFLPALAPASQRNHVFATPANMAIPGNYVFTITVNTPGDIEPLNNQIIKTVQHKFSPPPVDLGCTLIERFTGGALPTGWSNDIILGNPAFDTWRFNNPLGRIASPNITAPFAIFDSDGLSNNGNPENVALTSPNIAIPATYEAVNFSFSQNLNRNFGDRVFVEVSGNNGAAWGLVAVGNPLGAPPVGVITMNSAAYFTGGVPPATAFSNHTIDVTGVLTPARTFRTRFRYTGNFSTYWMVDNVTVCGLGSEAIAGNAYPSERQDDEGNIICDSTLIAWGDTSVINTGFMLTRTTDTTGGGFWEVLAVVGDNPTPGGEFYKDGDIVVGVRYFYRVQYIYATGLGAFSKVFDAVCGIPEGEGVPPYEAVLTGQPGYRSAYLNWNAPLKEQNDVVGYEIYGFDTLYTNILIGKVPRDQTNYTVEALLNGSVYGFRIVPVLRTATGFAQGMSSNKVAVRPSVILSGQNQLNATRFEVYPNPNNGSFKLDISADKFSYAQVRVFSTSGQMVFDQKYTNANGMIQTNIDLGSVANGLYILSVTTDMGVIQKKVSIQK